MMYILVTAGMFWNLFVLIKELWNTLIWDVRRYIGKAFRLAVQGRRKKASALQTPALAAESVQRIALKNVFAQVSLIEYNKKIVFTADCVWRRARQVQSKRKDVNR